MSFRISIDNLIATIRRPGPEMERHAKREINASLLWANRQYPFKFAQESLVYRHAKGRNFVYLQGSVDSVDSNLIIDGGIPLRSNSGIIYSIANMQKLKKPSDLFGQQVEVVNFNSLIEAKVEYEKLHTPGSDEDYEPLTGNYSRDLRRQYNIIAFELDSALYVYPTPTADTIFRLEVHTLFPELVADDDTNPFLTYARDFIHLKALAKINIFLREEQRVQVTNDEVYREWESLKAWDTTHSTAQGIKL